MIHFNIVFQIDNQDHRILRQCRSRQEAHDFIKRLADEFVYDSKNEIYQSTTEPRDTIVVRVEKP